MLLSRLFKLGLLLILIIEVSLGLFHNILLILAHWLRALLFGFVEVLLSGFLRLSQDFPSLAVGLEYRDVHVLLDGLGNLLALGADGLIIRPNSAKTLGE